MSRWIESNIDIKQIMSTDRQYLLKPYRNTLSEQIKLSSATNIEGRCCYYLEKKWLVLLLSSLILWMRKPVSHRKDGKVMWLVSSGVDNTTQVTWYQEPFYYIMLFCQYHSIFLNRDINEKKYITSNEELALLMQRHL